MAQVVGGFGAGANTTSAMAILSSIFQNEERDKYIGLFEASCGIGMLCGPCVGGILYEVGGYSCPFITFTCLYVLFYPFIGYYLIKGYSSNLTI